VGRTSDAKERLIRSGSELVHQRGYSAVSVGDTCAEAGVQKGSFYHFFDSKVDFVAAVIDEYTSRTAAAFDELATGDAPPLERLSAYLENACRFHADLQKTYGQVLGCPIGNLAIEMSTLEAELRTKVDSELRGNREAFASCLREAVERGDIAELDVEQGARAIQAQLYGTVMQAKVENDPNVLDQVHQAVFKVIGVKP